MGNRATISGARSVAMGSSTLAIAFAATAMGANTTASGTNATAMGNNTTAASNKSLSLGQYNQANTSADNTRLVVGNGSSGNRSDALVLDDDGDLTISGELNSSSDRRLKEQIQSLGEGALKKLGEIRPVRFRFKNERTHPSGEQLGLIAQDVRKEFPALVSEGSGGYLSVSYSKLTAVLLKGLQEQQSRIEEQQKEIDALRSENAAQSEKIDALEQRLKRLETLVNEQADAATSEAR